MQVSSESPSFREDSFIEIDHIIRSIKKQYPHEDTDKIREIVFEVITSGVSFRNQIIKTKFSKYSNKLTNRVETRYFFKCPRCESDVRKIYALTNDSLGCRKCCKIKTKNKINSQADRVLKIQKYLHDLYHGHNLSSKKKRQLTKFIVNHYNSLDEKYKISYNTFVFKELQNWCLDISVDKNKSTEYKQAIKDVLSILKTSKQILIKTCLVKPGKKDFKI